MTTERDMLAPLVSRAWIGWTRIVPWTHGI